MGKSRNESNADKRKVYSRAEEQAGLKAYRERQKALEDWRRGRR